MLYGLARAAPGLDDTSKFNRFLAALPPADFALLAPHLRAITLERGAVLYETGADIEHVYFPHSSMISLVAVMQNGATVETVTLGRDGAVGITAGLGSSHAFGRAVVQLPGAAARISVPHFRSATKESAAIHDLVVRYNDLLTAQVQQSVACNALHMLEPRLCRWLLQTHDCVDGDMIPLTQESLAQMLGVRRTTVTITARLLQSAGMIRYRRGLVRIVDRAALEDAACECYAAVRQHVEETFAVSSRS